MCTYVVDVFTHCSCGNDKVVVKIINYQQPKVHFPELKQTRCHDYPHRVKAAGVTCLSRVTIVQIQHTCNDKTVKLDINNTNCKTTDTLSGGRYGFDCYEPQYDRRNVEYSPRSNKFS
uniref:SUEL-type lectin domain-containing protein n=1 Tax=Strongyloides papillosus TaxID=174720 RepID=A0A0N5B907_STREA